MEWVVSHKHIYLSLPLSFTVQLTIHDNNFDSMTKDTCKLDVFVGGELVEFKSQCEICRCGEDSLMCRFCV